MKNLKNVNPGRNEKSETRTFTFYWIFEGNGDYTQKHDEMDYRRYIESNYISKSNLEF